MILTSLAPAARQALPAAAALALAACATAPVPEALQPSADQRVFVDLAATGVQIYECRAGQGAPQWAFVAPDAQLFDARGRRAGTHGAGPFWQAPDGSRVVGSVQARSDVAGAIPWLLLRTRSTGGPGAFERVSHIQRLHTEGGLAPADGCRADRVGAQVRVPYRADYRLFVPA